MMTMEILTNVLVAQTEWALFVLRFIAGVIFILHGWRKVAQFSGTASWFASIGLKPGVFWAGAIAAIELLGGASLLVGLAVPLVALLLALVMVGAALVNLKNKQPFFKVLELDLILLASLLLLATLGGGRLAIG